MRTAIRAERKGYRFHGAQKVAQRVEYLIGLGATTGGVSERLFDAGRGREGARRM